MKTIKINKNINLFRILYKLSCFLIPFVLCFVIININKSISNNLILNDDFLLNFLGVILGLGITIITFIYTSVGKVRESILRLNINKDKADDILTNVQKVISELKQDLKFIFFLFFISFIIAILKEANIPFIKYNITIISKCELIALVKLYILSLAFLSIFDIVTTLFSMLNVNENITNKKN